MSVKKEKLERLNTMEYLERVRKSEAMTLYEFQMQHEDLFDKTWEVYLRVPDSKAELKKMEALPTITLEEPESGTWVTVWKTLLPTEVEAAISLKRRQYKADMLGDFGKYDPKKHVGKRIEDDEEYEEEEEEEESEEEVVEEEEEEEEFDFDEALASEGSSSVVIDDSELADFYERESTVRNYGYSTSALLSSNNEGGEIDDSSLLSHLSVDDLEREGIQYDSMRGILLHSFDDMSFLSQGETQYILGIICHGGYFAAAFYDCGEVVTHKTFHRYVTRKKAGQRQANKDKGGGKKIRSVGSEMRRANEKAHREEIKELLEEWSGYIEMAQIIVVQAAGINRGIVFCDEDLLSEGDPRVRTSIPFTTGKANFTELGKAVNKLLTVLHAPLE